MNSNEKRKTTALGVYTENNIINTEIAFFNKIESPTNSMQSSRRFEKTLR